MGAVGRRDWLGFWPIDLLRRYAAWILTVWLVKGKEWKIRKTLAMKCCFRLTGNQKLTSQLPTTQPGCP